MGGGQITAVSSGIKTELFKNAIKANAKMSIMNALRQDTSQVGPTRCTGDVTVKETRAYHCAFLRLRLTSPLPRLTSPLPRLTAP